MKTYIDILKDNRISDYAVIPFSDCCVTREYLLSREENFVPRSVLCFLVPYDGGKTVNISRYAAGRDYHGFMKEFTEDLSATLKKQFAGYRFLGFSDHSPIDERLAAVRAGLGVFGKNGLLISARHSSFVFIGEIVSDLPAERYGLPLSSGEIRSCEGCGLCVAACPTGILRGESDVCLSALTQKKGELTEEEKAIIRENGSLWGCDVCQNVCPHTKTAMESGTLASEIPYFTEDRIPNLTREILDSMTEEEFERRAFSWRGKAVLYRNLSILEGKEGSST